MKKSKWIVLLSLMLCATIFLSSCGRAENILEDVYDLEKFVYEVTVKPTKAEALSTYTGWDATQISTSVIQFTKGSDVVLYNYVTAKAIVSITATDTLFVNNISGHYLDDGIEFVWVSTSETVEGNTTYKTTIYKLDGSEVASAARTCLPQFQADIFLFDGAIYRVAKDGSVSKAFDYNSLSDLPQIVAYNEEYYYGVDIDSNSNLIKKIFVYDKSLNLLNAYVAPSYAEILPTFLANGNILIQYALLQPDDAKEYTYLDEENGAVKKYTLTSLLYDVEDGEASEIELDYVVEFGMCHNMFYGFYNERMEYFNEEIENYVVAYPIVDKRIDESPAAAKLYAIDNKGGVDFELNDYFTLQGMNLPDLVAPGYFAVDNEAGQTLLLDKNGEVVGDVTNAIFYESYMIAGGKIYGYDMKMIYDYALNEMSILKAYQNCMLLQKGNEIYLFANGAVNKFIDEEAAQTKSVQYNQDNYFVVITQPDMTGDIDPLNPPKPTYDYYNDLGAKFYTTSQSLFEIVAHGENCLIVKGINETLESVYYIFSE